MGGQGLSFLPLTAVLEEQEVGDKDLSPGRLRGGCYESDSGVKEGAYILDEPRASRAGREGHRGREDPQVDVKCMRRYPNTWALG